MPVQVAEMTGRSGRLVRIAAGKRHGSRAAESEAKARSVAGSALVDRIRSKIAGTGDDGDHASDEEEEYEVEKVLKARKGGRELYVKWAGYPASKATWEPRASIAASALGAVEAFEGAGGAAAAAPTARFPMVRYEKRNAGGSLETANRPRPPGACTRPSHPPAAEIGLAWRVGMGAPINLGDVSG
jgi:hypothetical protein